MKHYWLTIELLSDLCVSDGGVYNSTIDMDVCHDELGFPYIPAKRIKGCLRECAKELNDWGISISIERLFGMEGNKPGTVRISNAYLKHDQEYRQAVQENQGLLLTHPQNVLRQFTYIRTQTSMDEQTGAAKSESLRMMRVVKKGFCFVAEVVMPESDFAEFSQCCRILKHMGNARTRGMGEVTVTVVEQEKAELPAVTLCPWKDGAVRLEYEITLLEPMLCKAVGGNEEKTEDYIEGAKILGLIAQVSKRDGDDAFLELMGMGELICSNAYLAIDGERLTPVPACYYTIKNQKNCYVDKTCLEYEGEKKERQLNQMKEVYVREMGPGQLRCETVQMEERYHHRRPDNKAIGRATGDDNSVLYQLASISAGQKFRGVIEGSEAQIAKVYDYLKHTRQIRLGAGRTAEYGSARMEVTRLLEAEKESPREIKNGFLVKLEAPLLLYGEHAAYTTSVKELIREINAVLQLDEEKIEDVESFINTTSIGGYHVTWGMNKPVLEVFDKGSVLYYHIKQGKTVHIDRFSNVWAGERVNEGYGEISVKPVTSGVETGKIISEAEQHGNKVCDICQNKFLKVLSDSLLSDYINAKGSCEADKRKAEWISSEAAKPTVSNMLLMCREMSSFGEIQEACQKRFEKNSEAKVKKMEISENVLKDCEKACEGLLKGFEEQYQIRGYGSGEELLKKSFLQAYLLEVKYLLHKKGDA